MKHKLLRLLALLMLGIPATPLFADAVTIGGINYIINSDYGYAFVSKNSSFVGDCVIPESVSYDGRNYPVTTIVDRAFEPSPEMTSITIPHSISSIGQFAFANCSGLSSVYIEDLRSWCNIYFKNSSSNPLTSAHRLYLNGVEVTDLVIPNTVTAISDYAFYGCSGLKSVSIHDNVAKIGSGAFANCSGLMSVELGKSISDIGAIAFAYCSGLTSVTIPSSVISISTGAFEGCSGLTAVYIEDLTAWCKISFHSALSNPLSSAHKLYLNGEEVTDLIIPDSVTAIGNYAFSDCTGLTSVAIHDFVTSVGVSAFAYCSGLTSVSIGNSVTSIGGSAFYKCTALLSMALGNSVSEIGTGAFDGCKSLTSIAIPSSVTSIGGSTFSNCSNLASVYIEDLSAWCGISFGGLCANPLSTGSKLYLNDTEVTDLVIPDSVTVIGNYAFDGCSSLTGVEIHDSVTEIGLHAFWGCGNLSDVKIGDSVTTIMSGAFCGCRALTSLELGNSVSRIYAEAFFGCSALPSITIPASVKSIGSEAFRGCAGMTALYISDLDAWCEIKFPDYYSNPLSQAHKLYLNGAEVTDLNVPNDLIEILPYTFYGGSCFASIRIPDSVTRIGSYAFSGCNGIESLVIPNSVRSLGAYSFASCSNLESVLFGDAVSEIANYAFSGCKALLSVTSLNTTPPSIVNIQTFENAAYANAILHVPGEAIDSYKTAAGWKNFSQINSEISGVEDVAIDMTDVTVEIYRLDGVKVGSNTEGLAPGVYVKRQGHETNKIIVY